jgi:hypothetical protein
VRFGLPLLVFAVAASVGTAATVFAVTSCTATTTINTALVTDGLNINTELLLGSTIQCGPTDDQVYRYVAVVVGSNRNVIAAGVFDCFANGEFANLPGTDAGQQNFSVWVYAYNQADFNAANGPSNALENAVGFLNGLIQPDGSVIPVAANSVPEGGHVKIGTYPYDLGVLCKAQATWVTECQATSQAGVQVLAACNPLALEGHPPTTCALPLDFPDAGQH